VAAELGGAGREAAQDWVIVRHEVARVE